MITIKEITKITDCAPTQWIGLTEDAREIYIRYRYGELTVKIDGELIHWEAYGDEMDGYMDNETMEELTNGLLDWHSYKMQYKGIGDCR